MLRTIARESKSAGLDDARNTQLQEPRATAPCFLGGHLRAAIRPSGKLDRKLLHRESVSDQNEHALEEERVAACSHQIEQLPRNAAEVVRAKRACRIDLHAEHVFGQQVTKAGERFSEDVPSRKAIWSHVSRSDGHIVTVGIFNEPQNLCWC